MKSTLIIYLISWSFNTDFKTFSIIYTVFICMKYNGNTSFVNETYLKYNFHVLQIRSNLISI